MPEASPLAARKVAVSLVILLILALHALPVIQREQQWRRQWPFLLWAMYKSAKKPGPIVINTLRIAGTTAEGARVPLTSHIVGLPPMTIGRMYSGPMSRGDLAAAQQLMARINRLHSDSFVELRLEGTRYRLTNDGIVPEEIPVRIFPANHPAAR